LLHNYYKISFMTRIPYLLYPAAGLCVGLFSVADAQQPNVILIYTDDLGYGDLSCYGAQMVNTPHIDSLAAIGLRFTQCYSTAATSTPSRYSLLTGEYAWRRDNTNIAPGDACLIIDPDKITLADVMKKAGYTTAAIGKWHLGLGASPGPEWNSHIVPGPAEIGFDYSYLIPATGDRVPCVYVENGRIVNLDPADPVKISYTEKIGNEPTGHEHPELLKQRPSHGHDQTIINGISRIGYMTGGKSARWIDEDMADTLTSKAKYFIGKNKDHPFFLYFATHDIHVPRVVHARFAGKSGLGARGDAILQLDWCVGELMKTLRDNKLEKNTLIIFSSDNGPVVDDGYHDQSAELLGGHKPAGPLRGGKYSAFEAGTRVPFIVVWPGTVRQGTTPAAFSQIDLLRSFAAFLNIQLADSVGSDSFNHWSQLTGNDTSDREFIVQQSVTMTLSVIQNDWKYIEPSSKTNYNPDTKIEFGNTPEPKLYHLSEDISEQNNVTKKFPEKTIELARLLESIRNGR